MTVLNFKNAEAANNWVVVDDAVMGGLSSGAFEVNEAGNALFHGLVSLENNGGFSSVRQRFQAIQMNGFTSFRLNIKGDGNPHQFRVKTKTADSFSYVFIFQTTREWQVVEIPFSSMYPAFRGKKLAMPNYPGLQLEEIAFLAGNKEAVSFKLEIAEISAC